MVTPDEFRSRTSLTFSRRSGSTLKVDAAYDAYYSVRTDENAAKLHKALDDYLLEHGSHWERCERDKVSGGLLKHLYKFTTPPPTPPIQGTAEDIDQRARARIDQFEIPHSRFGVLFLLANIDINLNALSFAIEGVGAVGGAVGSGFALDTGKLHDAESARHAFTAFGKDVNAQQLVSGGQLGTTIGSLATAKDPVKVTSSQTPLVSQRIRAEPPPRAWFPTTTAALEAAAEGIPEVYNHNRFAGIMAGAGAALASPVVLAATALYDLGAKLFEKIKQLVYKIKDYIVGKILSDSTWPYQTLGKVVKAATKFLLDTLMKQAAPFVGAAIDLGTGLAKTVDAAITRISSYLDRRRINIVPGHPEEIANSIEGCMTQGIFLGLADVLKGAGGIAIQAFLPGLGNLVTAVVKGVEWLIKLIYRLAEVTRISHFLKEARALYLKEKANATEEVEKRTVQVANTETVNLRNSSTNQVTRSVTLTIGTRNQEVDRPTGIFQPDTSKGIIANTEEFTKFFRKGCDASPLIPMLTLNTGICGSLMTMVKMFDDRGVMIQGQNRARPKEAEFDIAGRYFARLKEFASKYLKTSGYEFTPVDSNNAYIRGLLYHAVEHHHSRLTKGKAVMAFLSG